MIEERPLPSGVYDTGAPQAQIDRYIRGFMDWRSGFPVMGGPKDGRGGNMGDWNALGEWIGYGVPPLTFQTYGMGLYFTGESGSGSAGGAGAQRYGAYGEYDSYEAFIADMVVGKAALPPGYTYGVAANGQYYFKAGAAAGGGTAGGGVRGTGGYTPKGAPLLTYEGLGSWSRSALGLSSTVADDYDRWRGGLATTSKVNEIAAAIFGGRSGGPKMLGTTEGSSIGTLNGTLDARTVVNVNFDEAKITGEWDVKRVAASLGAETVAAFSLSRPQGAL